MHCAKCGCTIHLGELEVISSLYGSNHVLCKTCGDVEEKLRQSEGSNDLPDLLASYGPANCPDWY